jgi:hypothetical protein
MPWCNFPCLLQRRRLHPYSSTEIPRNTEHSDITDSLDPTHLNSSAATDSSSPVSGVLGTSGQPIGRTSVVQNSGTCKRILKVRVGAYLHIPFADEMLRKVFRADVSLSQELNDFNRDPPSSVTLSPLDDNLYHLQATMLGPVCYFHGLFTIFFTDIARRVRRMLGASSFSPSIYQQSIRGNLPKYGSPRRSTIQISPSQVALVSISSRTT